MRNRPGRGVDLFPASGSIGAEAPQGINRFIVTSRLQRLAISLNQSARQRIGGLDAYLLAHYDSDRLQKSYLTKKV
jgi:hypothetical protein